MLMNIDWQRHDGVSASTTVNVTVKRDTAMAIIDIPDNAHTGLRRNMVLLVEAVIRARGLRVRRLDTSIHDGLENILAITPGSDIMGWSRNKRGVSNFGWRVGVMLDKDESV